MVSNGFKRIARSRLNRFQTVSNEICKVVWNGFERFQTNSAMAVWFEMASKTVKDNFVVAFDVLCVFVLCVLCSDNGEF